MTGTFSLNFHVNSPLFVKARAEDLMLPTFVWGRELNGKLIAQLKFILFLLSITEYVEK